MNGIRQVVQSTEKLEEDLRKGVKAPFRVKTYLSQQLSVAREPINEGPNDLAKEKKLLQRLEGANRRYQRREDPQVLDRTVVEKQLQQNQYLVRPVVNV